MIELVKDLAIGLGIGLWLGTLEFVLELVLAIVIELVKDLVMRPSSSALLALGFSRTRDSNTRPSVVNRF